MRQRLLAEPDDVGGEPVGGDHRIAGDRLEEIAAGHVEIREQFYGHRVTRGCPIPIDAGHQQPAHPTGDTRTRHRHLVADGELSGDQGAGHTAEAVRADDRLHR